MNDNRDYELDKNEYNNNEYIDSTKNESEKRKEENNQERQVENVNINNVEENGKNDLLEPIVNNDEIENDSIEIKDEEKNVEKERIEEPTIAPAPAQQITDGPIHAFNKAQETNIGGFGINSKITSSESPKDGKDISHDVSGEVNTESPVQRGILPEPIDEHIIEVHTSEKNEEMENKEGKSSLVNEEPKDTTSEIMSYGHTPSPTGMSLPSGDTTKDRNDYGTGDDSGKEMNSGVYQTSDETSPSFSDFVPGGNQDNQIKETYYSETIKKKKAPKGSLRKVVAASLIVSLIGAPLFGVGIGAGKSLLDNTLFSNESQADESSTQESEGGAAGAFSFEKESEKPAAQPVVSTGSSSYMDMIKAVEPSVVNISTTYLQDYRSFFQYEDSGSGSGIIFHEDDEKVYVVTNYHVIGGATTCYISISGSEQIPANYVGGDSQQDLAVISIHKSDLINEGITNVTIAKFGDSDSVQVGEPAIAIGNALGDGKTATSGIISALSKNLNIDGVNYEFIQTDAAINPGNSGGALVNAKGEVIGINTAKVSQDSVEGIGFAIPVNYAKPIIENLINAKSRPYLGITGGDVTEEIKEFFGLPIAAGVYVESVDERGGAHAAGLQRGDIITQIDSATIQSMEQLQEIIKEKNIGDKIEVRIIRNGTESKVVEIELVEINMNPF